MNIDGARRQAMCTGRKMPHVARPHQPGILAPALIDLCGAPWFLVDLYFDAVDGYAAAPCHPSHAVNRHLLVAPPGHAADDGFQSHLRNRALDHQRIRTVAWASVQRVVV